jgi:hypothetical protein
LGGISGRHKAQPKILMGVRLGVHDTSQFTPIVEGLCGFTIEQHPPKAVPSTREVDGLLKGGESDQKCSDCVPVKGTNKAVHESFCNSVKNWLKSIFMLPWPADKNIKKLALVSPNIYLALTNS